MFGLRARDAAVAQDEDAVLDEPVQPLGELLLAARTTSQARVDLATVVDTSVLYAATSTIFDGL